MENAKTLTEPEITILASAGAREERIRARELTRMEINILNVFGTVREEMAARYPGENIVYVELDAAARGGEGYSFTAYAESQGPAKPFMVFVLKGKTEGPINQRISDGLIHQLLLPEFEKYLDKLFASQNLPVVNYTASFIGLEDGGFDRRMSVAEHMAAGDLPQCNVILRVQAENASPEAFESAAAALEKALRQAGLKGSFYLMGLEGNAPDDWQSIKYRRQILL